MILYNSLTHRKEPFVPRFGNNVLPGVCSVAFVFLPGSQFDFYGFTFVKQEEAAQ